MRSTIVMAAMLMTLSAACAKEAITPDDKVVYKTVGETELKLHVFNPVGHTPTDTRPAIVFFFGGGWVWGMPEQFYQQSRFFAEHGFVAISAEYRIIKKDNQNTVFDCVRDGKSAVRWIRAHAAELGVDPERIVAAGGSAGGHVAACTGVIQGSEEEGEDTSISSLPNAMLLYNPVLDTTEQGYRPSVKLLGEEHKTDLSPCHHVHKGIVPTLICHGTADRTVPFENAERFARLMNEVGNTCELIPFEGQGHGFHNGSFFQKRRGDGNFNAVMDKSIAFLKEIGLIKPEASLGALPLPYPVNAYL